MARQHNRPYEPEFASLANSSNSPLSPPAGPETPVSYRPNVNRAKTKRWVEAKKYSYDGNDWGEDEWDEYDDDDDSSTPPVPQLPPNANQSTGDIPSTLSRDAARPPALTAAMDRSRSMDHVATLGADSGPGSRGRSAERNTGETADRQAPIIRPADIYPRMQEQQAPGQEQSSWSTRSTDVPAGVGPLPSILTETVPNSHPLRSEMSGDHLPHRSLNTAVEATSAQEKSSESLSAQHGSFSRLPDVKRLSGVGADFFAGSAPSVQKDHPPESDQGHQLHHNPSFGYRSVVHQAFDVETPSTTIDSIERSNSGSTSAISPIIPSRAFGGEDEKTPTIVEEPESTSPPKDFKFGHRRDLSVPSPGNSPSRQPIINNNDNIPTSSLAELATHNSSDLHQNYPTPHPPDTYATPAQSPTQIAPGDRPSPLHIAAQTSEESRSNLESVPVIIPSLAADDSPQDTESDRLRKEIIRSLSRENTPSDEPDQQDGSRPQTGRQDSLVPSEYERYWNDEASATPKEQQLAVGYQPSQNNSQDLYSGSSAPVSAPAPVAASTEQEGRPQIKRRFSWESSSSSDPAAPGTGVQSPPGVDMPGQFPQAPEALAPPTITVEQDSDADRKSTPEKPKLTIITPAAMDSSSLSSDRVYPEVVDHPHREPTPYPENVQSADSEYQTPSVGPTAPPSIESSLLGFRDILGKKSPEERVDAFNRTRDQFASINTGLNHWIQVTVHAHPEHADVVGQSYSLSSAAPKPTMSRGKFPKLPSLGNFGTSEGSPSGSGHVRRPSAPLGSMMNKQQVEQRGKDLLHTAGMLGGKAGVAAKGLFAKGRSKFKGGNEKGFQTTRGYRRNIRRSEFEFSSDIDLSVLEPHDARPRTADGESAPWTRDPRPSDDHPVQFDIPRKRLASEEASGLQQTRPEYVRVLEQQMSAALGLQGDDDPSSAAAANLGPNQASPDVGREFEALANKHGGADGTAWESSYFDSSARTGPLQPDDEAEPLQKSVTATATATTMTTTMATVGTLDGRADRAAVEQQGVGAKADLTRPSASPTPSPPLLPTTTSCHTPHHVLDASLARPGIAPPAVSIMSPSSTLPYAPRDHHRRGSSAPQQLHPMASISSLGTQPDPESDLDLHRPRRFMFGPASESRVSLPSDMDDAPPRILGAGRDEGDKEAEQCASSTTAPVRLTPSTPGHDRPESLSPTTAAKRDSKGRSTMDKIVGRIRRPSNAMDHKAPNPSSPGQPQLKKPLDRLGGLFSRQHGRSNEPPPATPSVVDAVPDPEPHTQEPPSHPPSMDRLRPSTSQPPTPGHPPYSTSPGHTRPSTSLENTSFQGQLPPPGGYFAPDSFAQFRDAQDADLKLAQQINAENIDRSIGGPHRIPSPVGIPRHSGSGRSAGSISGQSSLSPNSPRYPAPASPPLHQPRPHHHASSPYHQPTQAYTTTHLVSPVPSPVPHTPPSRGRSQDRTYAQDLHLRSRSPKTFAPRPEERHIPSTDVTDPAHRLGTFLSTNRRASRIGDQERPWKLTLPSDEDDTNSMSSTGTLMTLANYRRHTTSGALPAAEEERLPSYEEDLQTHHPQRPQLLPPSVYVPDEKRSQSPSQTTTTENQGQGQIQGIGQNQYLHPTRGQGRQINNSASPVELPVRRDDDSGEEITMSSTAYPGQEWRPLGYSDWEG